MAANENQVTRVYRNDSDTTYIIPGLGELAPEQRVSITSEFPPAINLVNYPGLVDVLAEEAAGKAQPKAAIGDSPSLDAVEGAQNG